MNMFFALYKKELKHLAKPFFIIIAAHIAMFLYLLLLHGPSALLSDRLYPYVGSISDYYVFLNYFMYGTIYLIPVLLAYSYFEEWNDNTSLQLLSLPIKRETIAWSKYMALVTMGTYVPIGLLVYRILYEMKIYPIIGLEIHPFTSHITLSFFVLGLIVWITGAVSITAGIMTSVRRNHLAWGIGIFSLFTIVSWGILYLFTSPVSTETQVAAAYKGTFFTGHMSVPRGLLLILISILAVCVWNMFIERHQEA